MITDKPIVGILAGGQSSRFGSNKALAEWNGHCVIEEIINRISFIAERVFIITNDFAPYSFLNVPMFTDSYKNCGPLAGIHSALKNSDANRVFILGCDMPLVSAELVEWMWNLPTWAPVVICLGEKGLEPLHAIYHSSLIPIIEHAFRKKELAIRNFLTDIPKRVITPREIKTVYHSLACLKSANTPTELERLKNLQLCGKHC